MRILVCISAWQNGQTKGGVSDLIDDVAMKGHEMGHSLFLVSIFGDLPDSGGAYVSAESLHNLKHPEGGRLYSKLIFWIKSLIIGFKYFLRMNERSSRFDLVISASPLFSFILPWFFKKVVVWENVSFFPNLSRGLLSRLRLATIPRKRVSIISPTFVEAQQLNGIRFCPDAVHIPNWHSRFVEPCLRSTPRDGKIRLIAAGALERRKGFDLAIRAIAILQNDFNLDVELNIYGDGNELNNLKMLTDSCGAKQVYFRGHVQDLHSRYKDYHCFLLSSRIEGFPLVLISALAAGVPAIAFDCPTGPSEIIKDKVNGYLARDGDSEDLALKVQRFVQHPNELNDPEKIRQSVDDFSFDVIIREFFEKFETMRVTSSSNPYRDYT